MKQISLNQAIEMVTHQQTLLPVAKALLVAISGIDGSGKGYITSKMAELLAQQKLNIATINIDGWLHLPNQRFSPTQPVKHFYDHAIRFDELFAQLVLPLRDRRSIRLEADYAEETASQYCKHIYQFEDIDVS